jgi:hypothetical protein
MKLNTEKLILGGFLLISAPFFMTMIAILIWFFASGNEAVAPYFALGGLLIGVVTDIFIYKPVYEIRFKLPIFIPFTVFVFYNIAIYTLAMGIPVLNLITAPLMGYYTGVRNKHLDSDPTEKEHLLMIIPFASAFVMLSLCVFSIFLALGTTVITEEIKSMLNLANELSLSTIIIASVIASFVLIFLQYIFTRIALQKGMRS